MKAIKFTKVSLEKLKHEKNSYRVSDLVTTGLSIEVRAIPSSIKTFYAEWSVISYNKEGRQKRHGARRKICRYGQKPIEAIRNVININLSNWKKTNTQNSSIRTLATLFKEFKKGGVIGFRVKARGQKLKYKPLTTKNYIGLIRTYVLAETNKASTKEMLTAPFRTDGNNYYKKLLSEISLDDLTKRDIQVWHSRLENVPTAANRALAALSVMIEWDGQRANPSYKGDNPCLRIQKYPEQKDKRFIDTIEKVLEIRKYCIDQMWIDPQFLCFIILLLEIGERLEDCFAIAWNKPISIIEQNRCSGWINWRKREIYLTDTKNRKDATIGLTDEAFNALQKLQNLVSNPDNNASWAAGSMWVFPRPTDNTKPINNSSYRCKHRDFNYKFGLATREYVRGRGKRIVYKYTNILTLKHLRKTFVTYYGRSQGLEAASLRMRHSSMEVTKNHYFNEDTDKLKVRHMYETGGNVVELKKTGNTGY